MAGWISSKLKVAETLLQQIDQQAAESLGKNEKQRPSDLDLEISPITSETKPLKEQLKKRSSDYSITKHHNFVGKSPSLSVISPNLSSDLDSNGNHEKEVAVISVNSSPRSSAASLTDGDWTELLSLPNKKASQGITLGSSNGVAGVKGLRKEGKTQRISGSGSMPALDVKRTQKVVRKSKRKSDIGPPSVCSSVEDGQAGEEHVTVTRSSIVDMRNDKDSQTRGELNAASLELSGENKNSNEGAYGGLPRAKIGGQRQPVTLEQGLPSIVRPATLDGLMESKSLFCDESKSGKEQIDGSVVTSSSLRKGLFKPSDGESDSDSTSSSDSESEREKEERRMRRQQILAETAAAKAAEAIKERENMVARLEGEKQSLEKILEERAKQQAQEASELQTTMMETMEAVEIEKQKHNTTRMEALARLAKLETANADFAKSLATAQWNLEIEVNRVAELRQQIELKEAAHEDLRGKISNTRQSSDKLVATKGFELEHKMLESEYSLLTDKVRSLQVKATTLETSIESTQREMENPTEAEVALKQRLGLLTDHLIQKQAQVEALSSEKATLLFKIESVSTLLEENKSGMESTDSASTSSGRDLESGTWEFSRSKLRPLFEDKMRSGQQHLTSIVRQLDSIFCYGAMFLRRNSSAKIWSLVYLVCLHLWVVYIFMSHSHVPDDAKSGAVISLETINKTGAV